jgi:hypothetical protein
LVIAIGWLALLAFDLWLFFVLPGSPVDERVSFFLEVLGLYAIGIGLLDRLGLLQAFAHSNDELTSPELRTFLAANFMFASTLSLLGARAVRGLLYARQWYALLVAPLLIVATPVLLIVIAAYFLAVVPIAYLAYVAASMVLVGLSAPSPEKYAIVRGDERLDFEKVIPDHLPALRSFLVGAPSIALAILSRGDAVF